MSSHHGGRGNSCRAHSGRRLPINDADAGALPGKVGPPFTRFNQLDDAEGNTKLDELFTFRFVSAPNVATVASVGAVETGAGAGFELCRELAHQAGNFRSVLLQLGEVEIYDPCSGDTWRVDNHEAATVTRKRAGFEDLADCLSL